MASGEGTRTRFTQLDETPSEAVINAVVSATGEDPLEMEPLATVIDPDALDDLFRRGDEVERPPEVQFGFHGCEVLVRGDGSVLARQRDA